MKDDKKPQDEDSAEQNYEKKSNKEDEELQQKLEDSEQKYRRALADYQNLEKRVSDQRREWIQSSNRELLLRILPILDTLLMAQKHSTEQTIQICIQQFLDVLKQEGVQKIEAEGKKFDPMEMEVISTKDGESGKVLEEVRYGFKLYDRILRPVQVIVGQKINN